MDADAVRAFYDERWADFRYANRLKCFRASAILAMVADTRLTEPRILDVGCGAGWLTNILSMFGPATGVDLSPEAVQVASKRYPHVRFEAGDLRQFGSGSQFDLIVAQEVLEHFENHADFVGATSRMLAPGGWLILTTPNAETLAAMPLDVRRSFQNQPVENPVGIRRLRELLSSEFQVIRTGSIAPGWGSSGFLYRTIHSRRFRAVWDSLLGFGAADSLSCELGLGLHLIALARKVG